MAWRVRDMLATCLCSCRRHGDIACRLAIISTNRGSKCKSMHNITLLGPWEHISGLSYTPMTRSHCCRCWNLYIYIKKTSYEYEGNGGSQSLELTETHLRHKGDPLSGSGPRGQISGWRHTLMNRSHCWRWSNTLYMYKEDLLWVWTGWGVSIISTNRGSKCESMHHITFRSMRGIYKAGATPLWPVATVEGAQTLYIYIKKTCYEYELYGGSQS